MRRRYIYLVLCVWLTSCAESTNDGSPGAKKAAQETVSTTASSSTRQSATTTVQLDARTAQMWSRSCALCHVDGNAGAPRIGNRQEWQPRLAQGETLLLKHTVEGLNAMPPLGYCMACENQHFVDMIRFMSGSNTLGDTP